MRRETQFVIAAISCGCTLLFALVILYGILASLPRPIETRSTAPRVMGLPPAPRCDSLYNTGRHKAWSKCMGVPYR